MHSAIQRARRFLVDLDLEEWVHEQNVQRGISPVPTVVLRAAAAAKRRRGVEVPRQHSSSRRWLQRWRTRCGLRLRRFKALEVLPEAVLRKKAKPRRGPTPNQPDPPFPDRPRWPFSGRNFRTAYKRPIRAVLKSSPENGRRFFFQNRSRYRARKTAAVFFQNRSRFCDRRSLRCGKQGGGSLALEQLAAERGSARARKGDRYRGRDQRETGPRGRAWPCDEESLPPRQR